MPSPFHVFTPLGLRTAKGKWRRFVVSVLLSSLLSFCALEMLASCNPSGEEWRVRIELKQWKLGVDHDTQFQAFGPPVEQVATTYSLGPIRLWRVQYQIPRYE